MDSKGHRLYFEKMIKLYRDDDADLAVLADSLGSGQGHRRHQGGRYREPFAEETEADLFLEQATLAAISRALILS